LNPDAHIIFHLNRATAEEFEPARDVELALTTALAAWSELSGATLTLASEDTSEENSSNGIQNVVYFTSNTSDCPDSDEFTGGCAISWGEDPLEEIEEDCDIAILVGECEPTPGVACPVATFSQEALTIALEHELGHCLGFAHNTFEDSVMQSSESAGLAGPGGEDSAAIAYLYDSP
jgi:hypothetical protein